MSDQRHTVHTFPPPHYPWKGGTESPGRGTSLFGNPLQISDMCIRQKDFFFHMYLPLTTGENTRLFLCFPLVKNRESEEGRSFFFFPESSVSRLLWTLKSNTSISGGEQAWLTSDCEPEEADPTGEISKVGTRSQFLSNKKKSEKAINKFMDKLQSTQHQCLKIPQSYINRVFCPIFLEILCTYW